ncbi:MAG: NfeD family protein [Afipia sp.]|nr:NfeD family protein [Afipia sp.]
MIDALSQLSPWHWLIVGVVLMGVETFAPGVFMLWFGIAALIVGLVSFAIASSWQTQILAFAVLSIAMVPLYRHFTKKNEKPTDKPFLNKRAQGLIGRVFTLERPIVDGVGTVKIDDTVWRVSGSDAPAGSRVKVIHADGASLQVGPA